MISSMTKKMENDNGLVLSWNIDNSDTINPLDNMTDTDSNSHSNSSKTGFGLNNKFKIESD